MVKAAKAVQLHVDRPVYRLEELNAETSYVHESKTYSEICKKLLSKWDPFDSLLSTIPILRWLSKYKRRNVIGDIIAGITVAIMNIPQGMAYGLLGNVAPLTGIYMAFFPVLVYAVLGTSRHVSMGTFAVVCLMTGKIVSKYSSQEFLGNGTAIMLTDKDIDGVAYNSIEVATAVTFSVALCHFVMYVCRLGIAATLLSETLVNAFTCGCAVHVVVSQLKDLFGLSKVINSGNTFKLVRNLYQIAHQLPEANIAAITMSVVFVTVMVLNNELLKPRLAKITKVPFPIELLAVVMGTVVSYCFNLYEVYGINIVGHIPTGLPSATLPPMALVPYVFADSIMISIISYAITMSMALIFAQRDGYEINSNQEFIAMGSANLLGSCFSCMPVAASLSRSLIQHDVGGVTQVASIISSMLLLIVLLYIGPLFENLPRCVLASIIVVALKGMLMQCKELKKFWRLSKYDACVWIVTFFVTTIISIDIGLMVGMMMSLLTVFVESQTPHTCLLGTIGNTELYMDVTRHRGVYEIEGIKIFRYCGILNFASKTKFRTLLYKRVGINATAIVAKRRSKALLARDNDRLREEESEEANLTTRCIVIDVSALTYVDPSGVDMLRKIIADFAELHIDVFLASCSDHVYETFKKCDRYECKSGHFVIFATVHDAVMYAKSTILESKNQ